MATRPTSTPGTPGTLATAGLALASFHLAAQPALAEQSLLDEARRAYESRQKAGQALRSVELFEQAITAGPEYEACWEGARAAFYYGYFALPKRSRSKRLAVLKKGASWAEKATELRPAGAEGHFYHASLLGGWGEVKGLAGAMVVARRIRRAGEKALELDRAVECAGPLRLLGRYYFKLPAAFGGSRQKALELLEEAYSRCPRHPQAHTYLADVLAAVGERDRARSLCEWVLANPSPGREYRQFRADAERILKSLP